MLKRCANRAQNEWGLKSGKFKDAVEAASSLTYKYVKLVPTQDADGRVLDPNIKFVLERCILQFVSHVNLSTKLFNRNRAEKDRSSLLSEYIPNPSDRSKVGAYLLAQLFVGRYKFVEGGIHTLDEVPVRTLAQAPVRALDEDPVRPFCCHHCPFKSPTRGGLGNHMLKHRQHKCHANACDAVFRSKKVLRHSTQQYAKTGAKHAK